MTTSRNIALAEASGEIVAFLDDDSFAFPTWMENLAATFNEDASVGAVGGRALNNQPGEAENGVDQIGRLLANGTHTGNFAADPKEVIEVDHIMGCNMSFRRAVLAELGGFREDYPGISGIREDTDMCLRVKNLGYRILFNPKAVVEHVGAAQAVGRRFDHRYAFYSARNHIVMLIRNQGLFSVMVFRYLCWVAWFACRSLCKSLASALVLFGVHTVGTIVGIWSGIWLLMKGGASVARHDAKGERIRRSLAPSCEHSVPVGEAVRQGN